MKKTKKNVLLADCDSTEVESLTKELIYSNEPFVIESYISNWKRTGILSELRRYVKYFLVPLKFFLERKKYDAIVGWQQFYTLIFSFYCSLFNVKKSNFIAVLNFTYKKKNGFSSKIYKAFMKKSLNPEYVDYIHVLSNAYAEIISKEFDFPRNRIVVFPFGVNDDYEACQNLICPEGFESEGYVLALGRSNRDYDFLISAWDNIEYPLVIISDTYKGETDNENITILRNVTVGETYSWIKHCSLMVIPIDDGSICSGDTVLLSAMSLKKKIIVTYPSTLAEMYIEDGVNAVVSPKEKKVFSETVYDVLNNSKYADLGEMARNIFLERFSRQSMGKSIMKNILSEQ